MCIPNPCWSINVENSECAARLRMPDCRLPRSRSCCPEFEESRCSKLWMFSRRPQEICLPQSLFCWCFAFGRQGTRMKVSVRARRDEAKRLASLTEEARENLTWTKQNNFWHSLRSGPARFTDVDDTSRPAP